MILWAMLSASVALDRDDIWRQTEGIAFLSAACGIKKKTKKKLHDARSYFYSALLLAPQLPTPYLPDFFPLGLTYLVLRVIKVEDHGADKFELD